MLYELIKSSRKKMEKDLAGSPLHKLASPILYAQHKITIPLAMQYLHGNLIDIGCGYSPYREKIMKIVDSYDGYDRKKYNDYVTILGDIQELNIKIKNSYDCALCLEVLEHLPNPGKAIGKISEILKVDGYIIISVPLFNQVHEEPYDFYRFTKYGISELLSTNGFKVINIIKKAGFYSFIGHQISIFLNSLFWSIPIINLLVLYFLYVIVVLPSYWLDKFTDKNAKFAQGYAVIAQKK